MKIDEFVQEYDLPDEAGECEREDVVVNPDEVVLITTMISINNDVGVIEHNGVCYEVSRNDILDIEIAGEPDASETRRGRLVTIRLHMDSLLYSKKTVRAADLVAGGTWVSLTS